MMEVLDLRQEPESRLALSALAALRDMDAALVVLTRTEPVLLMLSLNLQLRDSLAWESVAEGGYWRTVIRLAPDTASTGIIDTLVRQHRQMDALLGRALRRLNAGDQHGAKALIEAVAAELRRHLRIENEVLAPALGPADDFEPLVIMLREHGELLQQLAAVEEAIDGEAWELESYVAMLSGTLAKHEHREESGLFPVWAARIAALDGDAREALARGISP